MGVGDEVVESVESIHIERMGKRNPELTYPRKVKVNVKTKAVRDAILDKAKILNTKNETWKKVYVKKDVHLVYARENQRIYNKRKDLKEKNPDKDIKIVDGKLLVDEQVVDRNMFFR